MASSVMHALLITATLGSFCFIHATRVALSGTSGYDLEGYESSYSCKVDANFSPPFTFLLWRLNDKSLNESTLTKSSNSWRMILHRNYTGSVLMCIVQPSRENATLKLNVRKMNPPYNMTLEVNSSSQFCAVDENCSVNVTIGRLYQFTCNASESSRASDIIWWINSTELNDTAHSTRVEESDDGSSSQLTLLRIRPALHHDNITCTVLFPDNTFEQLSMELLVNEQDYSRSVPFYVAMAVPTATVVFGFVLAVFACKLRARANHLRQQKNRTTPKQIEDRLVSEKVPVKDYTFPSDKITLQEVLGSGHFGQVYKATADGILEEGVETVVAVKVLKVSATCDAVADFEKEIAVHKTLKKHPNVVSMLGYCTDSAPSYLILEYLPGGTLQQYLRDKRESWKQATDEGALPVSPSQLLTFASQIASGMEYLSSVGCIHRDLAARNVLLDGELVCKLSDFGLARDVSVSEQYEKTSRGVIPVRWLAIECLVDDTYTTKSDVWSFGVLLWEIITLGARPYYGMHAKEVIGSIVNGYRLPPPVHCSGELYSMMEDVWRELPYRRPTFRDLRRTIDKMIPKSQFHLDMANFEADKYVTN